jgi:GNAT superfamily N-acetyltransferase
MAVVRLTTYHPQYASAFAELNYEWIETYFAVEDEDRAALEDPHAYAIATGGEIFFVMEDELPVGTVAMVPFKGHSDGRAYELAKMAVAPACQGRGYSHLLMQACIAFAKDRNADEIVLITNDVLTPALGLYTASGFKPMPANSDTRYSRGNLEMRLRL